MPFLSTRELWSTEATTQWSKLRLRAIYYLFHIFFVNCPWSVCSIPLSFCQIHSESRWNPLGLQLRARYFRQFNLSESCTKIASDCTTKTREWLVITTQRYSDRYQIQSHPITFIREQACWRAVRVSDHGDDVRLSAKVIFCTPQTWFGLSRDINHDRTALHGTTSGSNIYFLQKARGPGRSNNLSLVGHFLLNSIHFLQVSSGWP